MFENPFSPLFGGRPDVFFGRHRILENFEAALAIPGSDYRSLFITGARGFGKTALLEQLSSRAAKKGWEVVGVGAENALQALSRQLTQFDEVASSLDPRVEEKVLGSGGSLGGKGSRKTAHYTVDDLDALLVSACERARRGVLVTVDEIQKVPLDDVSRICGAFQMASRKGQEAMLAVAGLTFSHEAVVKHDGCAYMRRAVHEELGLFSADEARSAFAEAFGRVKGLEVSDAVAEVLTAGSSGHPYMVQLLGYAAVNIANANSGAKTRRYTLTGDDAETCVREALGTYERRALAPIVDALTKREVDYLRAAAACLDEGLQASTADIANALGTKPGQLSHPREQLVRSGILVVPARGKVRFGIPFLRQYLAKGLGERRNDQLLDEWRV